MTQYEAPAYSIGDNPDKIIVRVDGGKFMDTVFSYETIEPDEKGIVNYSTKISQLIYNSLLRDQLEVETRFPEISEEFRSQVSTPILYEIIEMLNASK